MAKFRLAPNTEIDVLTADELREELSRAWEEAASGWSRPAVTFRDFNSTLLDSSGNSGIPGAANNPNTVKLFDIKPGYTMSVHRLTIQAEGQTFGTTYSGGFIYLMRAGRVVDFADLGNGMPIVFSYTSDAPEYTGNESVGIYVSGGPHSTVLICDIQATLEALPGQLVFT